jgi:hypothetical protein
MEELKEELTQKLKDAIAKNDEFSVSILVTRLKMLGFEVVAEKENIQ